MSKLSIVVSEWLERTIVARLVQLMCIWKKWLWQALFTPSMTRFTMKNASKNLKEKALTYKLFSAV